MGLAAGKDLSDNVEADIGRKFKISKVPRDAKILRGKFAEDDVDLDKAAFAKRGLTYPGNDISACVKLLLANGTWHPGYPSRRPVTIYVVPSRVPVKRRTSNFEPRTTTACGSKNRDFRGSAPFGAIVCANCALRRPLWPGIAAQFLPAICAGAETWRLTRMPSGFPNSWLLPLWQWFIMARRVLFRGRPSHPQPMPGTARFNRPARSAERNKEA
jgi:hypothetical protein